MFTYICRIFFFLNQWFPQGKHFPSQVNEAIHSSNIIVYLRIWFFFKCKISRFIYKHSPNIMGNLVWIGRGIKYLEMGAFSFYHFVLKNIVHFPSILFRFFSEWPFSKFVCIERNQLYSKNSFFLKVGLKKSFGQ